VAAAVGLVVIIWVLARTARLIQRSYQTFRARLRLTFRGRSLTVADAAERDWIYSKEGPRGARTGSAATPSTTVAEEVRPPALSDAGQKSPEGATPSAGVENAVKSITAGASDKLFQGAKQPEQTATAIVEEVQEKASEILATLEEARGRFLDETRRRTEFEASAIVKEAEKKANEIVAAADGQRERLLGNEATKHAEQAASAIVREAEARAHEIIGEAEALRLRVAEEKKIREAEAVAIVKEAEAKVAGLVEQGEEKVREMLAVAEAAQLRVEEDSARERKLVVEERRKLSAFLSDVLREVQRGGIQGQNVRDLTELRELKERAGGSEQGHSG
jgi:hypothetical protein